MEEEKERLEVIAELEDGICLAKVDVNALREQDLNARVMEDDKFNQLVANIGKRGTLEQLPYCVQTDRGIEIVSGHHRTRAARAAGLDRINILLDRSKMSRSSIAAKQLAHNAIQGVDDRDTLAKIAMLITDVDDMLESAMDKEFFEKAEREAAAMPIPKVDFEWKTVQFSFLPHQLEDMKTLCDKTSTADWEGVADIAQFDRFVEALNQTKKFGDVKNVGSAVHFMTERALKDFGEDGREYRNAASVFGRGLIPERIADKLQAAIKRLTDSGKIENPWEIFDYLLGDEDGDDGKRRD